MLWIAPFPHSLVEIPEMAALEILALGQSGADFSSLPLNGAGADGPTESISVSGAQGRTQDFGAGSEDELQERIQEFRDRMQRQGATGFGGGGGQGPGVVAGPEAAQAAVQSRSAGWEAAVSTSISRTAFCIFPTTIPRSTPLLTH